MKQTRDTKESRRNDTDMLRYWALDKITVTKGAK